MKKILVTGGAGYIGSHTLVSLIEQGYDPIVLDNLCNSQISAIDRVESITAKRPEISIMDLRDTQALENLFAKHNFGWSSAPQQQFTECLILCQSVSKHRSERRTLTGKVN